MVRSERHYRFDVGPLALWEAISRVEDYRRWWPWLRGLESASFDAGATWRCVVQPPLPYSLRFTLELEEVEAPRFVTATVAGDLTGHAAFDIAARYGGSQLRLVSTLAPTSGVLRAVAAVAPAVARLGHDWVLDTGLRQFRRRAL